MTTAELIAALQARALLLTSFGNPNPSGGN